MNKMSVCDSSPTCHFSELKSSVTTHRCGACDNTFTSTCMLHQHLLNHSHSYLYDDKIKVAFPKFQTLCKSTQTNTDFVLVSTLGKVASRDGFCQPVEKAASDDNEVDTTELAYNFDVMNHSSQSDKCKLQSDDYTEMNEEHEYGDVYNHVNTHTESGKQSNTLTINFEMKTNLQPTVFTLPENDEIKSEQIKCNNLIHEDFGTRQELSSLGNIEGEIATGDNSEQIKTETNLALDQQDNDKPMEYFYGKISSNNYCIERERPKHDFGEKNELVKVNVTKTWYPLSWTENVEQKNKEGVKQVLHCAECRKTFSNKVCLQYHMNTHEGKKPYLCQDCGVLYSSKNTLNMHRLHHHAEKHHKCHVCSMMLPSAARLREHVNTHTRTEDYKYVCLLCDRLYKSMKNLREHVNYSHNEKQEICQNCYKVFPSHKEYSKHRNKCHQRKFDCDQCGKTFSSNGSLKRHLAIHTNHRPHKCHICHRRFLQKGQYWIHMVKYHDLTKHDLIELFPDKHSDKHVRRMVNNADIHVDEPGE